MDYYSGTNIVKMKLQYSKLAMFYYTLETNN